MAMRQSVIVPFMWRSLGAGVIRRTIRFWLLARTVVASSVTVIVRQRHQGGSNGEIHFGLLHFFEPARGA